MQKHKRMKVVIVSVMALLITLATIYYQRISGPSYPKKINTELNGRTYKMKFPRSHESTGACELRIPVNGDPVEGKVFYRRYPTTDIWDTISMIRAGEDLVAMIPAQPPAGKLQYFVELSESGTTRRLDGDKSTVIRFTGEVPGYILIPHIVLMFLAMFFSNLAGLQAAFRIPRMRLYMLLTAITMLIGGFIFGPVMQKFAFGDYWTGFPFGWDLTDNKTLIAMIAWILALILNARKARPAWIIVAAVVTLLIYCIPHSLFGSELNYSTGIVTSG
jgi:hypothetical protein